MNLVAMQEHLRNFSQEQLIQEMQYPSGQLPPYLLLTELQRRKRMAEDQQLNAAEGDEQTVAQDLVAAAGVPAEQMGQMAQNMAPQTDMMGNTGAAMGLQPQAPEAPAEEPVGPPPMPGPLMLSGGGIVALNGGGGPLRAPIRRPRPQPFVRDGMQYIFNDRGELILWGPATSPDIREGGNIGPLSGGADVPDRFPAEPEVEPTGLATPPRPARPVSPEEIQTWSDDVLHMLRGVVEPPLRSIDQSPAGQARILPSTRGTPLELPEDPAALLPGYEPPPPTADQLEARRINEGVRSFIGGGLQAAGDTGSGVLDYWGRGLNRLRGRASAATNAVTGYGAAALGFTDFAADRFRDLREAEEFARANEGFFERLGREAAEETPAEETPAPPSPSAEPNPGTPTAPAPTTTTTTTPGTGVASLTGGDGAGGAGGAGASGAAGGTAAPGSFEEFLQRRMEELETDRRRDKWLALAQFGLALMSSNRPTLGGAVGEAGTQALESLRGSYRDYNQTMMQLWGAREQSQLARLQLAARSAGGGARGPSFSNVSSHLRGELNAITSILDNLTGNDNATELQRARLMRRQADLLEQLELLSRGVAAAGVSRGSGIGETADTD